MARTLEYSILGFDHKEMFLLRFLVFPVAVVRMNVMQYYVKRCIALPGDTLEIRGGFYKVRGCHEQLGNYKAQQYLAKLPNPGIRKIVTSLLSKAANTLNNLAPFIILLTNILSPSIELLDGNDEHVKCVLGLMAYRKLIQLKDAYE